MNRRTLSFLVILVLTFFTVYTWKHRPQEVALLKPKFKDSNVAQVARSTSAAVVDKSVAKVASTRTPASVGSTASVNDMAKTLSQFTREDSRLEDLVSYLDRSGQQPQLVRNQNPYTGEMMIVRTKNPLPGTRYFHAQYFTDDSNQRFVQHMSFETAPGPRAMDEMVAAVKDAFPHLPSPDTQKDGYTRWSLRDQGYILWVKRLTAEDLKDNPFNAYSAKDIGTVRATLESEIHHPDEEHH